MSKEVSTRLSLVDNFTKTIGEINSSLKQGLSSMSAFSKESNSSMNETKKDLNETGLAAKETGSIFKSVLGANLIDSGVTKGIGLVTTGIHGMIEELNSSSKAWQTFEGNMKQMGSSPSEIAKAKSSMQDYATKTIYSASDMASTYAQLAAVGTKSTGKLVTGFGGLAAASEDPTQAMKTLSQQATQMAAKPKVAWEDFKLMLEQSPAGMSAVAKSMGKSASELISDIQNGKVKTQEFFDAIAKTGNNKNFTQMATQFKTVGQAMDGVKEELSNKLQPSFKKISDAGIKAVSAIGNAIGNMNWDAIASGVDGVLNTISKLVNYASENSGWIAPLAGGIFKLVKAAGPVAGVLFAASGGVLAFSKAASGLSSVLGLISRNKVVTVIMLLATAFMYAYQNIQPFHDAVDKAAKKIGELVGKLSDSQGSIGNFGFALEALGGVIGAIGIARLVKKFLSFKKAMSSTKTAAEEMGGGLKNGAKGTTSLKNGLNGLMKGASIALIIASLALLASAITPLAQTGSQGAVAMIAFGASVSIMAAVLGAMGTKLQTSMVGIVAFGLAVSVMALAMAPLAQTGTQGAIAMATFGAVIAGLAIVMAIVGPALTVASVGMLAFGAAVLMAGIGVGIASAGMALLASQLPIISQYGLSAALGLAALGLAAIGFGVGALVAGAGLAILSVGLLLLGVGATIAAVGMVLLGVATMVFAVGILMVGATIMIVALGLTMISATLPMVASGLMMAALGMVMFTASAVLMMAMSIVLTLEFTLLGVASLILGAGLMVVGAGAMVAGAGFMVLGAGLMVTAAAIAMVSTAVMMMFSTFVSIFSQIVSAVTSAMSNVVTAVSNGIHQAVNAVKNVGSSLISAGTDFVMGFVKGIEGAIGDAVAAAGKMAKSAVDAAKSFLHIHSPSRVMRDQVGYYVGAGMAVGIDGSASIVAKSSTNMAEKAYSAASAVSTPTLAAPQIDKMAEVTNVGSTLANGFIQATNALSGFLQQLTALNSQYNVGISARTSEVGVSTSQLKPTSITGNSVQNDERNSKTSSIVIEKGAIQVVTPDPERSTEQMIQEIEDFLLKREDGNLSFARG